MPLNDPGTLSRQQNADILAFVLGRNAFPAGADDLPTEAAVLSRYKFLASKP
jgi:hypothetical protein